MPTAMVTFNGRITLPPQVRKNLGLKTGDNVEFVEVEKGRFAISCRSRLTADADLRSPRPERTPVVKEDSQPVQ
jgi:AbrB family looped-hinge helix DNA binding protein